MISAGIRNDAAAAFVIGERRNLVVSPTQLERADGLQVFELQVELAGVGGSSPFEQGGADGNAIEERASAVDVS
jgi:hypothetical protein